MARYREFAKHLRSVRLDRGIRSAAELGRLTGLSASHIAMFERGEVLPRWATVEKLYKALKLDDGERIVFSRIIDRAGKPELARERTAGLAIPGAAIWRHLPYLLFEKHRASVNLDVLADEIIMHGTRVSASLLAWGALRDSAPGAEELSALQKELRSISDVLAVHYKPKSPTLYARRAAEVSVEALPSLWRHRLFRDRRAAKRVCNWIDWWACYPAGMRPGGPQVSFVLKPPRGDLSFRHMEPGTVARCHDSLIAIRLGLDLGLFDDIQHAVNELDAPWLYIRGHAAAFLKYDLDAVRRELEEESSGGWLKLMYYQSALRDATFACRLSAIPGLAEIMLGPRSGELAGRCAEAREIIDAAVEDGRVRAAASQGAPRE